MSLIEDVAIDICDDRATSEPKVKKPRKRKRVSFKQMIAATYECKASDTAAPVNTEPTGRFSKLDKI